MVDNRWVPSGASLYVKRRKLTAGKVISILAFSLMFRGITLERSRLRQIPTNFLNFVAH